MEKSEVATSLGKIVLACLIINLIILSAPNITQAKEAIWENNKNTKSLTTTINIETSGSVDCRAQYFDNPSRVVLAFSPHRLFSKLPQETVVNSGMVKKIACQYYKTKNTPRFVKTITVFLLAKTAYDVRTGLKGIIISVRNTPEQTIGVSGDEEFVIKDYMPKGYGSATRREAVRAAIRLVRVKREIANLSKDKIFEQSSASVFIEKRADDSVRITAANLTPAQMITAGAKALLTQSAQSQPLPLPVILQTPVKGISAISSAPKITTQQRKQLKITQSDLNYALLGFFSILLGVSIAARVKAGKVVQLKKAHTKRHEPPAAKLKTENKIEKNGIEELFLKEDELHKWPKYQPSAKKEPLAAREIFNLPPIADIAERRRFQRADIRNTRGILNRALVGSKTQPFKNIRVNDISKGGMAFMVKSRQMKFKSPTIVKLYFSNLPKPVDLWVRVVWEKDDASGDAKNVGTKFTKVPKETWDKILESFGHRLG